MLADELQSPMEFGNKTTLTCVPKWFFLWDFYVEGTSAGDAHVTYRWFSEQGTISLGGELYTIRKHGPFSGHWSLERDGETIAEARKPSALFRSFDVSAADLQLTVKAQSPLVRTFNILRDDEIIGSISPTQIITRRTVIECDESVPEVVQLFSFWLAVLTWRRQSRDNN